MNHNHAVAPTGNVNKPPPYMCKTCEEPILWDKENERWFHANMKQARPQVEAILRRQFDHFIAHLSDEKLAHLKEHYGSVERMLDAVLNAAMSNKQS